MEYALAALLFVAYPVRLSLVIRAQMAKPALTLTRKPVPAVLNTALRGELTLKKLARATAPPPTALRKASRVDVIAAG